MKVVPFLLFLCYKETTYSRNYYIYVVNNCKEM